tara:strand:- start:438 stop:605 length:168 start_codon:yes stop_codon:yes gene_type:complete
MFRVRIVFCNYYARKSYYIKDGKKNWSKTGSYFVDSYIDDDRLLCDYLYKSYIQK